MSTFEERRVGRAGWPVRRVALGEERLTDSRDTSTVDQRLALVWQLTQETWGLSGKQLPSYSRAEIPGKLTRPDTWTKDLSDIAAQEELG